MNINNICVPFSTTTFGNKTKCIKSVQNSNPTTFLEKYSKERTNSYTQKLLKDLKYLIASKELSLKNEDIKGVLGYGGLSTIFDLGNNEVLKCSLENPLEYRKHNPNFDIPFLSEVKKFGETYFVKEAKADTQNITIEDCNNVIKRIHQEGFEPSNDLDKYRTWQIGKYKDIPYLLDTRAAIPKPDSFSRFIYDCCNSYRRVYHAKSMDAEAILKEEKETAELVKKEGLKVLHMDETPRANLSFKEGIKKVRAIAQENIKFNQWNKIQGSLIILDTVIRGFAYKIMGKFKN